jgi:trehalose synthase
MLQTVDVGERSIGSYRGLAPEATLDALLAHVEKLRGARVLHINATPYGGGVAELLRSVVPLLNDLGLVADWKIISGDKTFFEVTKAIHNALQGAERGLSAADEATYRTNAEENARLLEEDYDFVFVHDPQPVSIRPLHGKGNARWIWRCHIDTSSPNAQVWSLIRESLREYDAAVFTMAEFVPPDLPIVRREIIPPAIDPLSPKNLPLAEETARRVLEWIGIRLDRPLITQVSRFDPWKDPLGVIAAYRLICEQMPAAQLALAGSMATDDPEGWEVYRKVEAAAADDPHIHVFTNLTGVGNIEVNAFQTLSDIVVQKSLREGFGLVVSEALWKGTPVVAGRAGGIPLQMADGAGGFLVDSIEDCARSVVSLLRNPGEARELGRTGRERVREHFLLPRLILNEVELMIDLADARPLRRGPTWLDERDPVCGMAIPEGADGITAALAGRIYRFCSEACRARFLDAPSHFGALKEDRTR